MYGCETWMGDVQQDCDEGMLSEPHLSPIWRQQSLSALTNWRGTKQERLGVPISASNAVISQIALRTFISCTSYHG
jgi:hypothetical protein